MIPRAMTQIVQEGIEPLLIGEKLLQKVKFQPGMQTVFPAIEPLRAEEAGDGMDLPIYNINIGGAQSFGVQVRGRGRRLVMEMAMRLGLFVPGQQTPSRTRGPTVPIRRRALPIFLFNRSY
jgi:hypothetical protein